MMEGTLLAWLQRMSRMVDHLAGNFLVLRRPAKPALWNPRIVPDGPPGRKPSER